MLIFYFLFGLCDVGEFIYLGDVWLLDCFDVSVLDVVVVFYDYVYLCDNFVGIYCEFWFYEQGDRSWLVVICNMFMYEIFGVELVCDIWKGGVV